MYTARELSNARGEERYEQYRVFEEKTDIGERLALPIENTLSLEVVEDAVYGRDINGELRRMTEWSRQAYEAALADPSFSGPNAVERIRRRHELDEAYAVEQLAVGEHMVVFSPIPDAALRGTLTVQGYRTDLARTFCRLYYRQPYEVVAVTLSLEQSDKQAIATAAAACGMTLPASLQSEDILATRHVGHVGFEDFTALPDTIRYHYDKALFERTGRLFFAGNPLAGRHDSMRFINENHDIIDEHMAAMRAIEGIYPAGKARETELETLRQRTAAALDERLHGGVVTSLSDASVSERMETGEYGGECALGASQTAQEAMGLAQGKHRTNCPLCGTRGVTATVEGETITCSDCRGSVDICTGKVTIGKPKSPRREMSRPSPGVTSERPPAARVRERDLSAHYGEKVSIRKLKRIGSEDTLVVNRHGEVIAKL